MNLYLATFHTHLAAMRTHRALAAAGVAAQLAPVPRTLSASCGTCVLFTAEEPHLDAMDRDVERVVQRLERDGEYLELLCNE